MEDKVDTNHAERSVDSPIEGSSLVSRGEEYDGLDLKTFLASLAVNGLLIAQMMNLVGGGAYAQQVSAVVGGADKSSWIPAVVAIVASLGGPSISQAADYWGRKWLLAITNACGFIGCLIFSRATSMDMAIAGAVIAAVSYTSMPLVYAVASEIVPRRYRAFAQAAINISLGVGAFSALLIGPAMMETDPNGFRNFWYLCCALYGVAIIIFYFTYYPPLRDFQKQFTFMEKIHRVDWTGYGLLAVGIVLLNLGLSWSQNPYSWTDAHILAPFLLGVLFLAALAVHQVYFKKDGIFDHRLFAKDRNMAISLLAVAIEGMLCANAETVFFATNTYYFYEVFVLFKPTLAVVGLRFSVTFWVAIIASPIFALYITTKKNLRLGTVAGFVAYIIFFALMASLTRSQEAETWGYPAFVGVAIALTVVSLVTAAQLSAPPEMIALASGLAISVRFLGPAILLPIYHAAFTANLNSNIGEGIAAAVLPLGLDPSLLPQFINDLATNNQEDLFNITGVTPEVVGAAVIALQEAYRVSFRYVWIIAAALGAVGALLSLFIINPADDFTLHVDAPLTEKE